jgi:GAF domain-containing protein
MRNLLRSLSIESWPIWVKFVVGFLLAILLPLAVTAFVAQNTVAQVGERNTDAYILENGAQHEQGIRNNLYQANVLLDSFITNPDYRQPLSDLLEGKTIPEVGNRLVGRVMQSSLLNTDLYREARLLTTEGLIVAHANALSLLPVGLDNAGTPSYLKAKAAFGRGQRQSMAIFGSSLAAPTIEITHVIVNSNVIVGYMIVTLDTEKAIYAQLKPHSDVFPVYSYAMTAGDNPVIFSPPDMIDRARVSAVNSPAVQRAFLGESKQTRYAIGTGANKTNVVGYYGYIPDPTTRGANVMAVVTELDQNATVTQVLEYLGGARAFAIVVGLFLLIALLTTLFNQLFTPPIVNLRGAVQAMGRGDYGVPVQSTLRGDEIGMLSAAFVDMREQVRNLVTDLENRVAARGRDMTATQEISRFAATQRDLQTLMVQVVELIVKQFPNIYHAQIFLIDADGGYAVLRASTGEVGKMLLERGHRLAVGSVSVIGQVTQRGEVIIARDTATSAVHRQNEFLPHTRAELAIPLRIGDQIIGALDVQSQQRNAFAEDETSVLQTMADQLAVAIENARLYQESIRRLEEIEMANRRATQKAWQEYLYGQRQRQLASEVGHASGGNWSALRQQALQRGQIAVGSPTNHDTIPIAVPIQLRGQTLGAVEWELSAQDMDDNKLQLAQELANRLAISLDNARLFEESQRAAERERIVNAIAAKLTPQTEIAEILQTAVREVGQALRAPQVSIRLNHGNGNGNTSHDKAE